MPTSFICVDATVDGRKVGDHNGMFMTVEDNDEVTCEGLLLDFLKVKGIGDANVALLPGSNVRLNSVQLRTPNPGFFPTYPVHSRTTNCHRCQRIPQAKTNDL